MKYLLTILVLLGCLSADAGAADFNGIDLSTMCVSNNQAIRDQGIAPLNVEIGGQALPTLSR